MKKIYLFQLLLFFLVFCPSSVKAYEYIVIGWNDLGMHCANKYFGGVAVLPPYNNLMAQVIQRGTATSKPVVLDSLSVTYEVPGNTYSVGKTDFWNYSNVLFNATLEPNIGLTGLGLTGSMKDLGGYFRAEGIPLTPYTDIDLLNEDPFQLALIKVYDSNNTLISSTKTVIPVSNEIGCVSSACHGSENEIISGHNEHHADTPSPPILCAWCHSSNALGAPGVQEVMSLSEAIHNHHTEVEGITCYNCHPGQMTKCLRDTMSTRGMVCTDCHGNLTNVAGSIANGRQPWLQEPQCGNSMCHGLKGPQYSEEPGKLFRQSKGHGGLYCSACHGSPHAIVPTRTARDNQQNITLQGFSGTLRDCTVCHGMIPAGLGPHGLKPTGVQETAYVQPSLFRLEGNAPNPFNPATVITFTLFRKGIVSLTIYDITGKLVRTLVSGSLSAGAHSAAWDGRDQEARQVSSGIYLTRMVMEGKSETRKMALVR